MHTAVVFIHVIVAIVLVLTVLLQAGKSAGMGSAFGGSSGSVFGSRGPATLISKITCAAAVVFMITSLNLAIAQGGRLATGSVMDKWKDEDAISTVVPEAETTPVPTSDAAPISNTKEAETATSPVASTTNVNGDVKSVGEEDREALSGSADGTSGTAGGLAEEAAKSQ